MPAVTFLAPYDQTKIYLPVCCHDNMIFTFNQKIFVSKVTLYVCTLP